MENTTLCQTWLPPISCHLSLFTIQTHRQLTHKTLDAAIRHLYRSWPREPATDTRVGTLLDEPKPRSPSYNGLVIFWKQMEERQKCISYCHLFLFHDNLSPAVSSLSCLFLGVRKKVISFYNLQVTSHFPFSFSSSKNTPYCHTLCCIFKVYKK